jgi:hypothetical protein
MLAFALLGSFAMWATAPATQGPLLQAELHSANAQPDDAFGMDVALQGEWLVVPEKGYPVPGTGISIHRLQEGSWTLFQSLEAWGSTPKSVDIDGQRIAFSNPSSGGVGYTIVLRFNGVEWVRETYISSSTYSTYFGNYFGSCVDLDGDRLAIGSDAEVDEGKDGYVSVFERTASGWILDELIDGQSIEGSWFGDAVALSGDWLLVRSYDSFWTNWSYVHLFQRTPTGPAHWDTPRWVLRSTYPPDYQSPTAIALEGDLQVVGRKVYRKSGSSWQQEATLTGGIGSGPGFGYGDADIHANRIIMSDASADGGLGAAYLYERIGGVWVETAKVSSVLSVSYQGFGQNVSLSGNRCVLGAQYLNQSTGSAFVYLLSTDPVVFCNAKPNSQGCLPAIAFSGTASLSSASPFLITASQILNSTNGILFYGFGSASIPFQGGTLCAGPPIRRTTLQNSGGTPPPALDCTGTYSFDMNAYAQSGADPIFGPGVEVSAQYWYRDPSDPTGFGTGLSDALGFVFHP